MQGENGDHENLHLSTVRENGQGFAHPGSHSKSKSLNRRTPKMSSVFKRASLAPGSGKKLFQSLRATTKRGSSSNREPAAGHVNDWGMTSEQELEAVENLKVVLAAANGPVQITQQHLSDDRKLLRFLKARNFDMNKACQMYLKHLWWREKYEVDGIILETFPERDDILAHMPQGYHMCDKLGRPIYIQYVGGLHVHKLLSVASEERILRNFICEYEKFVHYKLPSCSEARGELIEQSLNILDVKGVSLGMLTAESQRMLKKLTAITQDNYPEMMGRMVIVNAPYIFKMIFAIVKPMLSARTVGKIEVLGANYIKRLTEHVGLECLPKNLGGTSPYTVADDIGPWSELVPKIASKAELKAYDARQQSRWRLSVEEDCRGSKASSTSGSAAYFSAEETASMGAEGGASPSEGEVLCQGLAMESVSGRGEVSMPMLDWVETLEGRYKIAFEYIEHKLGDVDRRRAAPAADHMFETLLYRVEKLEEKTSFCRALFPPVADWGHHVHARKASVREQPAWFEPPTTSSPESLFARVGVLDAQTNTMLSSYEKLARKAPGNDISSVDSRTPLRGHPRQKNWFTCCFA